MSRRKTSIFSKLLFLINSIFALLLVLAYLLPFIPPQSFPLLSVLSLAMPVLIGVNVLFFLYWTIRFKRFLFLSLLILLLGLNHLLALYKFGEEDAEFQEETSLKVMSFNVRQFNRYNWIKTKDVPAAMERFFTANTPDILCLQEFFSDASVDFSSYPYSYIKLKSGHSGQVIYSKYKIVNRQSLDFKNTANNAIYADIVLPTDTIRVVNMHLESLKIHPTVGTFEAEVGKRMWNRMANAFAKQQLQVAKIKQLIQHSPYPVMLCGDMNNSAFSYAYHELTEELQDAFSIAGEGFGKTFPIGLVPLRIDVVLSSPTFVVQDFKTFDEQLSDHYPIMAWFTVDKH